MGEWKQEDYPGMKVLNLVFKDARIPYRIRSKQPGKTRHGSRESYWLIEKKRGKGSGASFAGCSGAY